MPRAGERLEPLERRNPMAKEDRHHSDEASHVYTVAGMETEESRVIYVHVFGVKQRKSTNQAPRWRRVALAQRKARRRPDGKSLLPRTI